jgi:hypothetical protein
MAHTRHTHDCRICGVAFPCEHDCDMPGPRTSFVPKRCPVCDAKPEMPPGWVMELPGYAVDHGQTAAERKAVHVARYCDARGGVLKTHGDIPHHIVRLCLHDAQNWPAEFAV